MKTIRVEPAVIFSVKPNCPACGCGYMLAPKSRLSSLIPLSDAAKCLWCGWPATKWREKPDKKFLKKHKL